MDAIAEERDIFIESHNPDYSDSNLLSSVIPQSAEDYSVLFFSSYNEFVI